MLMVFSNNLFSGSGGKYDTTKEEEVKKVLCQNFFIFDFHILTLNFGFTIIF